jgi:DNA-binding protein Fis
MKKIKQTTITSGEQARVYTIVKGNKLSLTTLKQWEDMVIIDSNTKVGEIPLDDLIMLREVDTIVIVQDGNYVRLLMLDTPNSDLENTGLDFNIEQELSEKVQEFRLNGQSEVSSMLSENKGLKIELTYLDGVDALEFVDMNLDNFIGVTSYIDIFQFGLYSVEHSLGMVIFDKVDFDEDFKSFIDSYTLDKAEKLKIVESILEFSKEVSPETQLPKEDIKDETVNSTLNDTLEELLKKIDGSAISDVKESIKENIPSIDFNDIIRQISKSEIGKNISKEDIENYTSELIKNISSINTSSVKNNVFDMFSKIYK